jgi:hypothetical protein
VQAFQADSFGFSKRHRLHQIFQRSPETVKPPHHERIAVPEIFQDLAQAGPISRAPLALERPAVKQDKSL